MFVHIVFRVRVGIHPSYCYDALNNHNHNVSYMKHIRQRKEYGKLVRKLESIRKWRARNAVFCKIPKYDDEVSSYWTNKLNMKRHCDKKEKAIRMQMRYT